MKKTRHSLIAAALLAGFAFFAQAAEVRPQADLEGLFRNPPEQARVMVYGWHWINGHITKEGITADLENMARAGYAGAIIYNGGNRKSDKGKGAFIPEVGPVPGYLDEAHLDMIAHAADEAARLGLKLGMHAGAGWSGFGGPWIKPRHQMKHIWIGEHRVEGGRTFNWRKPSFGEGSGFVGCAAFRIPPAEKESGEPVRIPAPDYKLARKAIEAQFHGWRKPEDKFLPAATTESIPGDALISRRDVVDLTPLIGADGALKWQAPEGDWKVLTAHYAPNPMHSQVMAMPSGAGPDCDRLDPAAAEEHWKHGIQPVLDRIGKHAGTTFRYIQLDSAETGMHTWGADLAERFEQLHGYSPVPWLPALTGRVVESPEHTERFLRDYRKTLEVGANEAFAATVTRLCRENDLRFVLQPYGYNSFGHLSHGAAADVVQGEFWGGEIAHKASKHVGSLWNMKIASIGHTTGKNLVTAESFTAYLSHYGADCAPTYFKTVGDSAWCDGINAFWLHEMALNPYPGLRPGMYFGIWGHNFNPNALTWRDQLPAWTDYVSRGQALLQAGRFVADFLVHDPSDLGATGPQEFPFGYRFDLANDNTLLELSIDRGRLVLPDGMNYACLILPHEHNHFTYRRFTPEVLRHVAGLVRQGAHIVGEKPLGAWTMKDAEQADRTVERLSDEMWKGFAEGEKGSNAYGEGTVWWGYGPDEWARQTGLSPDLDYEAGPRIGFIHRRDAATDADWYFVASGEGSPVGTDVWFRVAGKAPELWDPMSGEIRKAPVWEERDGRTRVRLDLPAMGSVFVVFREPGRGPDPVATFRAAADPAPLSIDGPWTVAFEADLGGPAEPVVFDKLSSWHENADPRIKYYSGPATYAATINIPAEMIGEGKRLFLDLGQVKHTAEVAVNGRTVGVRWCPPFAVEITGAARPGANRIEIIAVNGWRNRWIGDEQLPPDFETVNPAWGGEKARTPVKFPDWAKKGGKSPNGRVLFSTFMPHTKDDSLEPAGLLGPVTLRCAVEEKLK